MPGEGKITVRKSWRSEFASVTCFFVFCLINVYLGRNFPASVLRGQLFAWGDSVVYLHLPLFSLVSGGVLILIFWRIYNVLYSLDSLGIEMRVGILALEQRVGRIRYEDVRSVDTYQSVLGRMLDFGDVYIGTAGTDGVEIEIRGIAHPNELQSIVQRERDQRQKLAAKRGVSPEMQQAAGE